MKTGKTSSEATQTGVAASASGSATGSASAAARDSERLILRAAPPPRRRGRRLLLWGFLLTLLAAGLFLWRFPSVLTSDFLPAALQSSLKDAVKADAKAVQSALVNAASGDGALNNAIGLALQGVSLFNGEKGAELWRLKATWAHLSQEGNEINVESPVVRYTMGDPVPAPADSATSTTSPTSITSPADAPTTAGDFLDVKADKGRVTDNQRHVTLWDNVEVKRFDDVVTGPRLNYDSTTRVMVFPEGAAMESDRAAGRADVLTWDLGDNVLVAEGGVDVILKPRPETVPDPAPAPVVQEPAVSAPVVPAVVAPVVPAVPDKAGTAQPKSAAAPEKVKKKAVASPEKNRKKPAATQKTRTKKADGASGKQ